MRREKMTKTTIRKNIIRDFVHVLEDEVYDYLLNVGIEDLNFIQLSFANVYKRIEER